jgi:hypothetical protein
MNYNNLQPILVLLFICFMTTGLHAKKQLQYANMGAEPSSTLGNPKIFFNYMYCFVWNVSADIQFDYYNKAGVPERATVPFTALSKFSGYCPTIMDDAKYIKANFSSNDLAVKILNFYIDFIYDEATNRTKFGQIELTYMLKNDRDSLNNETKTLTLKLQSYYYSKLTRYYHCPYEVVLSFNDDSRIVLNDSKMEHFILPSDGSFDNEGDVCPRVHRGLLKNGIILSTQGILDNVDNVNAQQSFFNNYKMVVLPGVCILLVVCVLGVLTWRIKKRNGDSIKKYTLF